VTVDVPTTLYVTDLDGTLLSSEACLSERSRRGLELLIDAGALVTCATARSWTTTQVVLGGFRFALPMVLHNGTFVFDPVTGGMRQRSSIPPAAVADVLAACRAHGASPVVYWMEGARERASWIAGAETEAVGRFWADRPGDPRRAPRSGWDELPVTGVFDVAVIGPAPLVEAIAAQIDHGPSSGIRTLVQPDTYHPQDTWLDVSPTTSSKADAVAEVARRLDVDRIVAFGDNHNDLPLFAIADECYAVAGAVDAVRREATGVIGSNDEDAVVAWIERDVFSSP
jgi:hydroxymethylpyrimidine pyrophosphatase-like HAD family hydrolase